MKPWMWPAAASGIGDALLVAALARVAMGISDLLTIVLLIPGAVLAPAALFIRVEGPFWRTRRLPPEASQG